VPLGSYLCRVQASSSTLMQHSHFDSHSLIVFQTFNSSLQTIYFMHRGRISELDAVSIKGQGQGHSLQFIEKLEDWMRQVEGRPASDIGEWPAVVLKPASDIMGGWLEVVFKCPPYCIDQGKNMICHMMDLILNLDSRASRELLGSF
jgi:hypothetical protein